MNKIFLILIAISITLTSCFQSREEQRLIYTCDCQQQAQASQFVKESILSANNMSDEEMEDVISQLEKTSVRLHCSQKYKLARVSVEGYLQEVLDVKQGETVYPNY